MMALMEERQLAGCQQWLEMWECMYHMEKIKYMGCVQIIHAYTWYIYMYMCIQSVIISR